MSRGQQQSSSVGVAGNRGVVSRVLRALFASPRVRGTGASFSVDLVEPAGAVSTHVSGARLTRAGGRARALTTSIALAVVLALVAVGIASTPAQAGKIVDRIVAGTQAAGTTGGLFNTPRGIAVNYPAVADGNGTDGWIYVADDANHRIQAFDAAGVFQWAIGRDVVTGGVVAAEKCSVAADCKAGATGTLAGEFDNPQGVAVNQTSGHVYVRDRDNRRVQEFAADGSFVRMWGRDVINGAVANSNGTDFEICDVTNGNVAADCKQGTTVAPGNGGAFASSSLASTGIAVMPPGASNAGNVFVVDPGNRRLQEFTATGSFVRLWGWDVVAAGQPGDLGTSAFEICSSITAGVCKAGLAASNTPPNIAPSSNGQFRNDSPLYVTADPLTGTVYADNGLKTGPSGSTPPVPILQVFDTDAATPAGLLLPPLDFVAVTGTPATSANIAGDMTVNPSNGNLFAARSLTTVGVREIAGASTATPTQVDVHYALDVDGVPIGVSATGVALNPTSGDLYAATDANSLGNRLFAADADGAPPASSSLEGVTGVGATTATLSGTVNPEGGTLSASYRFQYSADGVTWTNVAAPVDLGNGIADVPVQANVTGLEPNTLYRVRIATRKQFGNPDRFSPESTFVTDGAPPAVVTLPVGPRGATTAQLRGSVDPNGTPTTYWFEYGGDASYGTRIPIVPASAGAGNDPQMLVQDLTGLIPGTTYHYRVVADGLGDPVAGADQTFATFSTDGGADVPLSRGIELVSPPDKVGGIGVGPWYGGPGAAGFAGYAAHEGERFAAQGDYGSILLDGAQAYVSDWAFAERVDDERGWLSHSPITHPASAAQDYRWIYAHAANPSLSRVAWHSNGGLLRPFAEMAGWDEGSIGNLSFIGSWAGDWELVGPTDPFTQVFGGSDAGNVLEAAYSSDGGTLAASTSMLRGLAGEDDPTLDISEATYARNVYVADTSGELADGLPGTGPRVLASVCAGGTTVPGVDGSGDLISVPCSDGDLVNALGATIQRGRPSTSTLRTSLDRVVSDDGSRVFFMSPDPTATGVPDGISSFCDASGESCPAQLFVRQRSAAGGYVTRWISRSRSEALGGGRFGGSAIAGQDGPLLGQALFEGASADGDKVFFRSNSPLTPDDPNAGVPGSASGSSWDLYMYDFPDSPGADPGDGVLTRITAGPTGASDPNVPQSTDFGEGALRFVSEDGMRVYFGSAGPLAGVPAAANGTITAPGGAASTTGQSNLYLFDAAAVASDRWRFVARLPRSLGGIAGCATTGVGDTSPINPFSPAVSGSTGFNDPSANCVKGTADGRFVTFWTGGRLTLDDPDTTSGDVYGYDSGRDELARLTAPQGGVGGSYSCVTGGALPACHGDVGFETRDSSSRVALPSLGVATEPATAGDRIAYFQTRSRLLPEDADSAYDVYEWRNGILALVTPGDSPADQGQMYKGNDVSGRNVYFATLDPMSWQDVDSVMDVYTARVGGGIDEPPPAVICGVLAGACHSGGAPPVAPTVVSDSPGSGNVVSDKRKTLTVASLSMKARRKAARSGNLVVSVRTSKAGKVSAVAKGRIGKRTQRVASKSVQVRKAGKARLKLRLNRAARQRLSRGKALNLSIQVRSPGARSRSMSVRLPGASS
jgi:hypothetical protein